MKGKGDGETQRLLDRRAALVLSKDQQALTRRGRTCVRFVGRGGGEGGARGGRVRRWRRKRRSGRGQTEAGSKGEATLCRL